MMLRYVLLALFILNTAHARPNNELDHDINDGEDHSDHLHYHQSNVSLINNEEGPASAENSLELLRSENQELMITDASEISMEEVESGVAAVQIDFSEESEVQEARDDLELENEQIELVESPTGFFEEHVQVPEDVQVLRSGPVDVEEVSLDSPTETDSDGINPAEGIYEMKTAQAATLALSNEESQVIEAVVLEKLDDEPSLRSEQVSISDEAMYEMNSASVDIPALQKVEPHVEEAGETIDPEPSLRSEQVSSDAVQVDNDHATLLQIQELADRLIPVLLVDLPEVRNADVFEGKEEKLDTETPLWYFENGSQPEGRIKLVNINLGNGTPFSSLPGLPALPTLPTLSSLFPNIPTGAQTFTTLAQNLIPKLQVIQENIQSLINNLNSTIIPTSG